MLVSMKRDLHAAKYHFSPRAPFKRKIQQQGSRRPNSKWNTRLVWAFAVLSVTLVLSIVWLEMPRRAETLSEIADLHQPVLPTCSTDYGLGAASIRIRRWNCGIYVSLSRSRKRVALRVPR